MENRNSYFKPVVEEDSFYLEIFPAMEGGKDLDIKEVMTYLSGQEGRRHTNRTHAMGFT